MDETNHFPVAHIWTLIHKDVDKTVSDIAYLTAHTNHVNNWGRGGEGLKAIQNRMAHMKDATKPLEMEFSEAVRFIHQGQVRYLSARALARLVYRAFTALDFCVNQLSQNGYPIHKQGMDNPQINLFHQKGLFSMSGDSQAEKACVKEIREAIKIIPVRASDDPREIDMFDRFDHCIKYAQALCSEIEKCGSITSLRKSLLGDDYCLLAVLFRILRAAWSNVDRVCTAEETARFMEQSMQYVKKEESGATTEFPRDNIMRLLCSDMVPFMARQYDTQPFAAIDLYAMEDEKYLWQMCEQHVDPFQDKRQTLEMMLIFAGIDNGKAIRTILGQVPGSLFGGLREYARREEIRKKISQGKMYHAVLERGAFNALTAFARGARPVPKAYETRVSRLPGKPKDKVEESTNTATVLVLAGVVAALYLAW